VSVESLFDSLHHLIRLIDEMVGTQEHVLFATVPKEILESIAESPRKPNKLPLPLLNYLLVMRAVDITEDTVDGV